MFNSALLLASLLAVTPTLEAGTQVTYRGALEAVKGDPVESGKTFELTLLLSRIDAEGAVVYWMIEQEGRDKWPWTERFGRLELDARWRSDQSEGPALLYQREEGTSIVPVVLPLLAGPEPLKQGLNWEQGPLDYRVTGSATVEGREAWNVEVKTIYGHKRTVRVDKASPLVWSLVETVFIGQGERYELRVELADRQAVPQQGLEKQVAGLEALIALRDQLGAGRRSPRAVWDADQLALLEQALTTIDELQAEPPVDRIVQAVQQDTKEQKYRSGAVSALRNMTVGNAVEALDLEGVGDQRLTQEALQGKVTVLHFWQYRHSPLEEPYGQVGYLDFLYRGRKAEGVQVYGVAVDAALGEPGQRRTVISSVKKLTSFMNLSYPVLLDDGGVLKQFGDPRVTGAKLPVFVVIGPDSKVVHYHVGHYKVDRDRGLEALDTVVTEALKKDG